MKLRSLIFFMISAFLFVIWGNNVFGAKDNKGATGVQTIYGVRDDGFSFYITGKVKAGGDDLKKFKEVDLKGVEYPVLLSDIKVFFPQYNQAQLLTDFLINTTLNWDDIKIVNEDEKYSINGNKLLRISFKKYTGDYKSFNEIFKDVIRETMSPFTTKGDLKSYIYQYNGKKLIYIRETSLPENLKDGFDVESDYETIKGIKKSDIAIFIPYLRIIYLKNGYKIFLTDDFVSDFENQYNPRRIFIITRDDLRKKAEELFLKNIPVAYDNLRKAQAILNTIGTKEYEAEQNKNKPLPKINVEENK